MYSEEIAPCPVPPPEYRLPPKSPLSGSGLGARTRGETPCQTTAETTAESYQLRPTCFLFFKKKNLLYRPSRSPRTQN